MLLRKNDTLLITGDSITDDGRTQSADPGDSLGQGYPAIVAKTLAEKYPELGVKVINRGISGDRTTDILSRMERDHLALKPDVITILIGVNDVWRHFDGAKVEQVDEQKYRVNMAKIILAFKTVAREVVVLLPFLVKRPCDDPMYVMAQQYKEIAREEAQKAGVHFIDLQAIFDEAIVAEDPKTYSGDTVHPKQKGREVIARALMAEFEK